LKALALLVLLIGIVSAVVLLRGGFASNSFLIATLHVSSSFVTGVSVVLACIVLFFALLWFLVLYALGDLIFVLLAVEANTRASALVLQNGPVAAGVPSSSTPSGVYPTQQFRPPYRPTQYS
jgi:hypothetical protein